MRAHLDQIDRALALLAAPGPSTPSRRRQLLYHSWYLVGGQEHPLEIQGPAPEEASLVSILERRRRATRPSLRLPMVGFFAVQVGEPHCQATSRLYLRPSLDDVDTAVECLLAQELPMLRDGFQFKVRLGLPARRASDTVVVYLPVDGSQAFEVIESLTCRLVGTPPALTHQLGPGAGVAPELEEKRSFGEVVCDLVASQWEAGERSAASMYRLLSTHGVFTQRPHPAPRRTSRKVPEITDGQALEVAEAVLDDLTAAAVSSRPVWFQPNDDDPTIYEAVGPDLWSGTAGIALAFAEGTDLLRHRGEWRDVAELAIRASMEFVNQLPFEWRFGLIGGRLGVAAAACQVADILDDAQLAADALEQMRELLAELENNPSPHYGDIMTGMSGFLLWASVAPDSRHRSLRDIAERVIQVTGSNWKACGTARNGMAHGGPGDAHLSWLLARAGVETATPIIDLTASGLPDELLADEVRSWCGGSTGALASMMMQGIRPPIPDDIAAWIRTCRRGYLMPGSLCHGPLGAAAVIALHGDGDASAWHGLLQLLGSRNRAVASYRGEEHDYPGLFTGRAGAAHVLLRAVKSMRSQKWPPLRTPFGVLDPW